ncbi:hypothetical protein IWW38_001548, partial [Coemansia aciculifera]
MLLITKFLLLRQRRQLFPLVRRLGLLEAIPDLPLLQRFTTHVAPIPESEASLRPSGRRDRHNWTPEGDEKLLRLVTKYGLKWKRISKEMDLGLAAMSYRRRWEVLQATKQGAWTLTEDRKLEQNVAALAQTKKFGSYGWWVQIARLMDTERSPRDCYWRWSNVINKPGGAPNASLRASDLNTETWLEDELSRFDGALSALLDTGDSAAAIDRASEEEPWLVPVVEPRFTQPAGFWILISEMVGTRTAQQCRNYWVALDRLSKSGSRLRKAAMSIAETKQLARLVEKHGRKWQFIQEHHFPHLPRGYLFKVYAQWMATASAYKVDLHSVNPEEMLVDYTPGACTALRRTGANGLYDPSGSMCFVRVAQSVSPLVPFHLALIPSIGDGQVSRLKKTK